MTVTVGGDARSVQNSTANPSVTLTGVPAGATIVVCISDRSGGMTVSGVSSDVDGSFGTVHTETVFNTNWRDVYFRRHNCTAGTHVLTGTLGVSQNSHMVACWADSDTGNALQDDAVGTPLEDTSADTTHTSTTATATSQPGVAIYLIECGSTQTGNPSALSSGTLLTTTLAGGDRSFLVGEPYSSTGAKSFTATLANSSADRSLMALFKEVAAGPAITSVNGGSDIVDGSTFNIVGTGFGASQGAGSVKLTDGSLQITLTVNSWAATLINATASRGTAPGVRFGTNLTLTVADNSAATDTDTVQLAAAADASFVDLVAPLADASDRLTASPDLDDEFQIHVDGVVGGTIADVQVYPDGSYAWEPGVSAFTWRAHNVVDGWGAAATQYVSVAGGTSVGGRNKIFLRRRRR